MSRPRRRIPVLAHDGKVLRHVSRIEAEAMVVGFQAAGREINGDLVSVKLTRPERHNRLPVGSTITLAELEMNAGVYGAPVSDDDPIQTARDKIALWPMIGDTKAVRVRPRMSEADVERAQEVVRRADRQR